MADAAPAPGDPYLAVTDGQGARQVALGPLPICRIGRSAGNDIVIGDVGASRDHAAIQRDGRDRYVLGDAGSRNGTVLNGRPLTSPTELRDGDVIAIGAARLCFRDPRRAAAIPAAASAAPEMTMFVAQQSLITVLVIDVRGFTPLSRAIGEERLSALMATIFREAGRLLAGAGCWSEKFIGDAVMAVWKNEGDRLLSSELGRILDVVIALHALFADLQARFDLPHPLAFGAAINSGPASIGNMGSGSTADFTALGDTVNLTFRLETASKDLGADVVIGEATIRLLSPPLAADRLPPAAAATLKGYDTTQPVRLLRFADVPGFLAAVAG